jgi:hypothetical protein
MRHRDRLLAFFFVLAVIALVKIGQQVVRYYAFAEERAQISHLEIELEGAGLGVIETQVDADSLRKTVEQADSDLRRERRELERMEQQLLEGPVTPQLESDYHTALEHYNRGVNDRNATFRALQAVADRNHIHVDRYNLLVDSIKRIATAIGEPYYPVLSPAEIAVRRESRDSVQ